MTNQSVLDRLTSHLNSLQLQAGKGINIRRQGSAGAVIEATGKPASAGGAGGSEYSGYFAVTITGAQSVSVAAGRIIRKSQADKMYPTVGPPLPITGTGFAIPASSVSFVGATGSGCYLIATIPNYVPQGGACEITYRISGSLPVFTGTGDTMSEERIIARLNNSYTDGPFTEVIQQHYGEMVITFQDSVKYPFCIYALNNAASIGVQQGTVICGSQTVTASYGPTATTWTAGTYYVCLDVYWNSAWNATITVTTTPPTLSSSHYVLKLGWVKIADNKIIAIDQFVRGDVVLAGRWVD
jgi:hypothetical protein